MTPQAERRWSPDLAYALLLTAIALPWIAGSAHSTAAGYGFLAGPHPSDARLIVSILANVAHGLVEDPARLFDIPVSHPVPNQLAGSEHFLSSQILFGPLHLLGANALLAANLTALFSYVLAAVAMRHYLLALGCGPGAAWIAGLLFALGPFRTPGNLQVLQYPNLFLPLILLGLLRLAQRPAAGAAIRLFGVFTLALFSSYYMAALAGLVGAIGALLEYRRAGDRRAAFLGWGLAASLPPILALALFSRPYLERVAESATDSGVVSRAVQAFVILGDPLGILRAAIGIVGLALAVVGTITILRGSPGGRTAASRGLLFVITGLSLTIAGMTPLGEVVSTALPFFRSSVRFMILTGLGTAMLAAGAMDAVSIGSPRIGRWLGPAVCLAVLVEYGPGFASKLDPFGPMGRNHAVYERVARITEENGPGPLAEFPVGGQLTADAMVGATIHRMPLINGYTGYPSPGARQVSTAVAELWTRDGLSDLIAMTGVRWILLRPVPGEEGIRPQDDFLDRIDSGAIVAMQEIDDFRLIEVDPGTISHPWREALARGLQPGETVLGTPLEPPPPERSAARIRPVGPPPEPGTGERFRLPLLVRNGGQTAWPAAKAGRADSPALVGLTAAWKPSDTSGGTPTERKWQSLPRDFRPGDERLVVATLTAPSEPGVYQLYIDVGRRAAEEFSADGHSPLDWRIEVR
jgi:hypothetical protein